MKLDTSSMWGVLIGLSVIGCVPQEPVKTTSTFDSGEVAWAEKLGTNTVAGFAVLRTVGGEARTCAGLTVYLVPDSTYARERLTLLYGTTTRGAVDEARAPKLPQAQAFYLSTSKQTRCDGQGHFSFENVANGIWYVTASVIWKANPSSSRIDGGHMMQRVELRGAQSVKVAMP